MTIERFTSEKMKQITPRQEILASVINYMYNNNLPLDYWNGVLKAESKVYKYLSKPAQKWLDNVKETTHWKLSAEICLYLRRNIILDYSDFEPGGRYSKK